MARITGPETGHGSGISGPGMGTSHRVRECSRVGRTHTGFVFLLFTREAREGTIVAYAYGVALAFSAYLHCRALPNLCQRVSTVVSCSS
jgi:hypothetical protein